MKITRNSILSLLLLTGVLLTSCATETTKTYKISVTAIPEEGGTFEPNGGTYSEGEEVRLTAVPSNGWQFVRWEGDANLQVNPLPLIMDDNYIIAGVFERKSYPLEISTEGEGTVTERVVQSKSTDYIFETIVELTARAEYGWEFVRWEGDVTGSANPTQLEINDAKSVTAVFERANFSLEIIVKGEGSVKERIVQTKSTDYAYETVVELTAEPADGWGFAGWSGDINGFQNPTEIVIRGNSTVKVSFSELLNDIDGNVYKTVKIGEQVWTVENLKVTRYRDGTEIPNITNGSQWANLSSGAWAYYDNDVSNNDVYGILYNWYAVDDIRGLCPEGWHVPTDEEWTQLSDYLGGMFSAGGKMKATGTDYWKSTNRYATNESGFTGLPGGYRFNSSGAFYDKRSSANFWSSSSWYSSINSLARMLTYSDDDIYRNYYDKRNGKSVRCLKD